MTVPLATLSGHDYWWIALGIGLAAALVVALLLAMLVMTVINIDRSVAELLDGATKVAGNTASIPQLQATAPVLGLSTGDLLALLTIVLGVVVVLVLAGALIVVRRRLESISEGLATLASALEGVEAEHLRPLEGAVAAINAQFDIILGALPGIARKAAIVAERRPQ